MPQHAVGWFAMFVGFCDTEPQEVAKHRSENENHWAHFQKEISHKHHSSTTHEARIAKHAVPDIGVFRGFAEEADIIRAQL